MSSKNKIKFFKKISFKISLWYSLFVVIIITIIGVFLYYLLQHEINKEINSLLMEEIANILPAKSNLRLEDLKNAIMRETSNRKLHKISARLLDVNNNVLVTSPNSFDPPLQMSEKTRVNARNSRETIDNVHIKNTNNYYRLLTKPLFYDDSLKYYLQVAVYKESAYKALENFQKNIVMLIPVVIVITIIAGFVIARRSLSQVGYIIKSAQTITASRLDTRLKSPSTGDELEELTNTINHMLNRLEDSFKMVLRFTSDISHELRTPIATLKTGTEVVLAKDREAAEYRELLENNLGEFEKITRLIEDLLVILRADSGVESLNVASFSLSKTIRELGDTFALIAESKKIDFVINKMNNVQIMGDENLLRRVFSNLFDNAIKYTLQDGHIYVTLEERNEMVSVIVKDTGIGVSEDHKEKIFNRFFRPDSSRSRETGGFGLGLSICKHIVELHKGRIEVKSKLNTGSSFVVTLRKNILNS